MRISSSSSERESGVAVKDFKNPVIDLTGIIHISRAKVSIRISECMIRRMNC